MKEDPKATSQAKNQDKDQQDFEQDIEMKIYSWSVSLMFAFDIFQATFSIPYEFCSIRITART